MFIYRVWDTVDNVFWSTEKGKTLWNGIGQAKCAWMDKQHYKERPATFDSQQRYITKKFELTEVKETNVR